MCDDNYVMFKGKRNVVGGGVIYKCHSTILPRSIAQFKQNHQGINSRCRGGGENKQRKV